tara:strand:+ start:722 stop:1876 length:1155 start_codon:yes stop_codon:yes gene_type:complete
MGLLTQTERQYYSGRRTFDGDGSTNIFTISTSQDTFPASYSGCNDCLKLYKNTNDFPQSKIDSAGVVTTNWEFKWDTINYWHFDFTLGTTPTTAESFEAVISTGVGNYQFVSLDDIINNFMISYVGEGKIISKVRRYDVAFHAQRALAELSFDTFKSTKSQEIEVPSSLTMMIPHDYVNYVKLTWSDGAGIEHIIYPTEKTSNPKNIKQDSNGNYSFDFDGDGFEDTSSLIESSKSDTLEKFKTTTPSENQDDYNDEIYLPYDGRRYGLEPSHAHVNGSFFIDEAKGLIHFSSNLSEKTVILKYISDSLGTDDEMKVHKLAEEAMYKNITYSIISTQRNIPEQIVQRFKKERFAETRKAKLRLSNIKLEEITRILRGKSKHIKH